MTTISDTHVILNNGNRMPVIGLGTWNSEPGEVQAAVEAAIKVIAKGEIISLSLCNCLLLLSFFL